jgi:hypothetical protein
VRKTHPTFLAPLYQALNQGRTHRSAPTIRPYKKINICMGKIWY